MAEPSRWPGKLKELAGEFVAGGVRFGLESGTIESELWVLIQTVLGGYLVREIHNPEIRREELPGLAAEKTAELVGQIRKGRWRPGDEDDGKVIAYIRQVARNTAREFWRKWYRERGGEREMEEPEAARDISPASPESCAAGRETAARLHEWLGGYKPLHAEIFVMKAFYQMKSREIAEHPRVETSPTNVDTVWDRMRKDLRSLLVENGGGVDRFPPGTFSAFLILWEAGGPEARAGLGEV